MSISSVFALRMLFLYLASAGRGFLLVRDIAERGDTLFIALFIPEVDAEAPTEVDEDKDFESPERRQILNIIWN